MFQELKELWDFILKFLAIVKLMFSTPVISDKSKANESNKQFINCLKKATFDCIHHMNITEDHLNAYGLHINGYGTRVYEKDSLTNVGKLKYRKSKFISVSEEDKVDDSCNTFFN